MPASPTDPRSASAPAQPPASPQAVPPVPPPPPTATGASGRRRGTWVALAAGLAIVGTAAAVGLSGRDTGGEVGGRDGSAAGDIAECVPADPATATVESFTVTPMYPTVPGVDQPLDILHDVEVRGTITNTGGVGISATVRIPMVGYPDQVVYSPYIDVDSGGTVEYTATGMLVQEGLASSLYPDESAVVVGWTQTGGAVPGCDP